MVRLAEERREVRRDGVDRTRRAPRCSSVAQQLAVVAEALDVERAQPAREPSVHELALLVREVNAGVLLHELAQRVEVVVAEGEFALALLRALLRRRMSCDLIGLAVLRVQNSSTLPSSCSRLVRRSIVDFARCAAAGRTAGAVNPRVSRSRSMLQQLIPALRAEARHVERRRDGRGSPGGCGPRRAAG